MNFKIKRKIKIISVVVSIMFALSAGLLYSPVDNVSAQNYPKLNGMFVAPELCAPSFAEGRKPWGQSEWNSVMKQLSDVGMDQAVIQYSVQYYSETSKVFYYPPTSAFDFAGNQPEYQTKQMDYALAAAKAYNMNVFIGLQLCEDLWFSAMAAGFPDQDFLSESADYSIALAEDLWRVYGVEYGGNIAGWYLPFEFNNIEVSESGAELLCDLYYQPVTDALKLLTPSKSNLMSPIIYTDLVSEPQDWIMTQWKALYRTIWSNSQVEICAPQDGCGWESTLKENLFVWYDAITEVIEEVNPVRAAKGWAPAVLWNNPESYSMNGVDQMNIKRLAQNMGAVSIAEKHVSFSVHYFIPLPSGTCGSAPDNKLYYDAYKYFYENNVLFVPSNPIPVVKNPKAEINEFLNVLLSWDALNLPASGYQPTAGYVVKRKIAGQSDEEAIKIIEVSQSKAEHGSLSIYDSQVPSGTKYEYLIFAFDATGNFSVAPARVSASTASTGYEQPYIYGDNISAEYSVSVKNTDNAKTVGNPVKDGKNILLDNIIPAKINFWDLDRDNWLGIQKEPDADVCVYELKVTGNTAKAIGFIYLNLLFQPQFGVCLPEKIDVYAEDSDIPLATVYPEFSFASIKEGEIWFPIELNEPTPAKSYTIVVRQKYEWSLLGEIKLFEAKKNPAAKGGGGLSPQSLVSGHFVYIMGYSSLGDFNPGNHFRGIENSVFEPSTGKIITSYTNYRGILATDIPTRSNNSPSVPWMQDLSYSNWLGIMNIGSEYQLRVDLKEPSRIRAIGCEWLQDRQSGIYVPDSIEFLGDDGTGQLTPIMLAQKTSIPQIDWTKPPSEANSHRVANYNYWAIDESGKYYTKIVMKINPKYPNQWSYMRNLAIY